MSKQPNWRKTKTQVRKELQEVIDGLKHIPCTFRHCPGLESSKPEMICMLCWQIKELRRIMKEL